MIITNYLFPIGVDHEEEVQVPNSRSFTQWREGRRVVELGILADGLRGCAKCGLPLQLGHTTSILTCGLSAILKIPCSNTVCRHVNNIPTGKRQERIWDANVKLASASINAGLGERQVNTLLSGLNIPPVSHCMMSARQKDVGVALQEVAKETVDQALCEEVELTKRNKDQDSITAAVDAGWQMRGSGRSYNSLSGHCSMIGTETGKIVNYAVRIKSCRVCSLAEKSKSSPPVHECHMNWSGSAKSMEADMVTEMVKDVGKKGVSVSSIVGDEDSTTIARLRANVDKDITKVSDSNHVKKLLGNSLYEIRKKHKTLTIKVIQYLQRCFNYILAQGKGNPDMIKESILALSGHPFGQHERCNNTWCRFLDNPNEKFNSLPHGKPLTDGALQNDLKSVFTKYAENSGKLSSLGSTQANESFNRIVASKAPKQQHYSSSGSLNYRIAACVAQKNEGNKYILDVNKNMSVSPGYYTLRLAVLRDIQHRKRKAIANTYRFKQRRRNLKSTRHQKLATREVREGVTYSSGIGLEDHLSDDIEEIPSPSLQPAYQTIEWSTTVNNIFFDIEATGLARNSHITQISATSDKGSINTYVLPKKPITPKAQEITGIKVEGSKMFCHDKEVKSVGIKEALKMLILFLAQYKKNVIIGHNIKSYDIPVLFCALNNCSIMNEFSCSILGFLDTLQLFKSLLPGLTSYAQSNLYNTVLNETYDGHDSMEDVVALSRLFHHLAPSTEAKQLSSFSFDSAARRYDHNQKTKLLLPTLTPLTEKKVITLRTANVIAASGMSFSHLRISYARDGRQGIEDVLKEEDVNGKVRVTKSKKIVDAISDFFKSLKPDE
ncbi:uncharacterized protein LOC134685041 isoform X2 [Mytilus trossulus]|uniref:uncharacterized protein LOC134685041 isoform X2 n=1 Tax=Mytilus trossulus TaxID=6551 RepID=UPI0030055E00